MAYKAVLFDLDGTILDTLGDLKNALNYALAETGHPYRLTAEDAGLCFGSASKVAAVRALCLEQGRDRASLVTVGTPGDNTVAEMEDEAMRVLAVFKDYYPAHCAVETQPYPGILPLLETLHARGVRIAVVSNKLDAAVQTLCAVRFPGLVDAALGEQPGMRRKPAPDLVEAALRQLGVPAAEAVCVGDTEVDLETAKNALLPCIAVTWGFRSRAFLQARGAQRIAEDASALLKLLLNE